ncbi:VOC family protein [Nocardia sp. NPDC052566]|uniref:VOC family protein n=1 Tax=Nocardia sp. NPDC052566 TaxID=3364330 RepID=UPI0037CB7522
MTQDIHAFHHTGILTRDLDGLERTYRAFGFTLSPRSRHMLAARPGEPLQASSTANLCALFGGSYIELLGIVDESAPDPWHAKAMADQYAGFRILNLDTDDADAVSRRLIAAGLGASGVLDLEREVETIEGIRTMRAQSVHIDPRTTPEGYIGISQHLTREYVHQPRYLDHPNGARGISAVSMVTADAEFRGVAARYAEILQTEATPEGPFLMLTHKDIRLEIIRASDAATVFPGESAPAPSYLATMTIAVDDLAAARTLIERTAETRTTARGFFVSARDAYGAGLLFEEA